MRSRSAFTLVELLVVVAIMGILMALLLPAVQGAREAARRMTCVSNLKQLGVAAINYQSQHNKLPPSGIVGGPPDEFDPRSGNMFSWVVLLLPFMEQQPLFDRFDRSISVLEQPDDPQAAPIPIMLCPSDSAAGRFFVDEELTGGKPFAKGNYAAFVSPFHIDLQSRFPGALVRFGQKTKDIVDGTSQTLMFSEVRTRAQPRDQRGAWALPWNAASLLAFDVHHDLGDDGSETFEAYRGLLEWTQRPNNDGNNIDVLYACPDEADAQLNRMPCATWEEGTQTAYLSAAPRSNHPLGVNVIFVDGHGGFLSDDVDEVAMAYMISANDGHFVEVTKHVD